MIDKVTAYTATQAVTTALLARERGSGGQHVKLSMLDTALAFLWPDGMMQHTLLGDGVTREPHMSADYEVYRTLDGWITAMPMSDRQFPPAARALGRADWLDDSRFSTVDARRANDGDVRSVLADEFSQRSSADVLSLMHGADVPCAPLHSVDEVHLDPQVVHNGTLVEYDAPWIGRVRHPRPAIRFESTPQEPEGHAPRLDEHTDLVLAELGYTATEIASIRTSRAAGARTS